MITTCSILAAIFILGTSYLFIHNRIEVSLGGEYVKEATYSVALSMARYAPFEVTGISSHDAKCVVEGEVWVVTSCGQWGCSADRMTINATSRNRALCQIASVDDGIELIRSGRHGIGGIQIYKFNKPEFPCAPGSNAGCYRNIKFNGIKLL